MDVSQLAVVQQGNTATIPVGRESGRVVSGGDFKAVLEGVAAPEASVKAYTVQPGDTLTHIVRKSLQEQGKTFTNSELYAQVRAVAQYNRMLNPDLIHPGQRLDLTPLAPSEPILATVPPDTSVATTLSASPAQEDFVANLQSMGKMSRNLLEVLEKIMQPLRETPRPPAQHPSTPWQQTLDGTARLTSGYGMRKDPFTGEPAFHHGIDLAAKAGTPIHAYQGGTVTFSGWQRGYGRVVSVRHEDGTESLYAHCSKAYVKEGEQVTADTAIAAVGASGRATGAHLHFELRKNGQSVNPMPSLLAGLTASATPHRG